MTEATLDPVELLVCTTCKMGQAIEDDALRPGNLLYLAMLKEDLPAHITVRAVECFTNCQGGVQHHDARGQPLRLCLRQP